jgi:hypothetical protein
VCWQGNSWQGCLVSWRCLAHWLCLAHWRCWPLSRPPLLDVDGAYARGCEEFFSTAITGFRGFVRIVEIPCLLAACSAGVQSPHRNSSFAIHSPCGKCTQYNQVRFAPFPRILSSGRAYPNPSGFFDLSAVCFMCLEGGWLGYFVALLVGHGGVQMNMRARAEKDRFGSNECEALYL